MRGEGEVDFVLEGGDHGVDGAGEVGADEVDYVGVVVAEKGFEDEALGGLASSKERSWFTHVFIRGRRVRYPVWDFAYRCEDGWGKDIMPTSYEGLILF